MTFVAAISYGELAAMMPHAGGQYVYLRESFGPLAGFPYGWTLFLVIQTGTAAAVAVAFAKFLGVFVPWVSAKNYLFGSGRLGLSTQQLIAIRSDRDSHGYQRPRHPHGRHRPERLHRTPRRPPCSG